LYAFTIQDVVREFPEKNSSYLASVLSAMVCAGMLCRIPRSKYHIIPLHADPGIYVPDGYQVMKYMMLNEAYYIGYTSALKIHGLSLRSEVNSLEVTGSEVTSSEVTDAEVTEYVVTKKQKKPAIISFGGKSYQFVQHQTSLFFGFSSIWINQFEQAMVSDLEKTIVDMATNPCLCGGIVELGNALFQARDRTDHDKLFYFFARNMNISAKRRYLFLTDLLGLKWMASHDRMMGELGSGFSILDPAEPNRGEKRSKFGLKINVAPNHIKKKVFQKW
jgi:predicted transcriptional regulator of viral defense system